MSQNTISVINQIFNNILKMNQTLRGSDQADKITAQVPEGGSIYGLGGNDTIDISGQGNIFGGFGGQGDDSLNVTYNQARGIDLFGGQDNDKISFGGSDNRNLRIGMIFGDNETTIRSGSNNNTGRVYIGKGQNKFTMEPGENNSLTFVGSQGQDAEKGVFLADLYGNRNTYAGSTGNTAESLYVHGSGNTFGNLDLAGGDDHIDIIGDSNVGTITTGDGQDEVSVTGNNNHLNINANQDDVIILEGSIEDWQQAQDSSANRVYTHAGANGQASTVTVNGDAQVTGVTELQEVDEPPPCESSEPSTDPDAGYPPEETQPPYTDCFPVDKPIPTDPRYRTDCFPVDEPIPTEPSYQTDCFPQTSDQSGYQV